MPKQKLEIEIEVPDGYRCVGFGYVSLGTIFLNSNSGVDRWNLSEASKGQYFILERVEHWRPATVEDVIRSLQGEKVKARFRDSERCDWVVNQTLKGICDNPERIWFDGDDGWRHCEVLDTEDSNQ